MLISRLMEETRVNRCFLLSLNVALIKNRCALNADGRNRTAFSTLKRKQLWRSTVELRQHNTEMFASTNCFWFLLLFASLYYITAWTKKYYAITKGELPSPIIVKFAVIKLRGGFKPHFCHTRPIVCPSWFSANSATRKHCNCEYRELPPRVLDHSRILGI